MKRPPAILRRRDELEALYLRYADRRYLSPDPLELVWEFGDPRDREAVALMAASLSYGRVAQILASARKVLRLLGPSPAAALREAPPGAWAKPLAGFQHRWTRGADVAGLLDGIGVVLRRHGSLEACFAAGQPLDAPDILPGLEHLVRAIGPCGGLLSDPAKPGAHKRLLMFMRWMARRDVIDPGVWTAVPAAKLLVPLDTHMFRECRALGLTRRRQPGMPACLEITARFRLLSPDDPVKYDFALTRKGIRGAIPGG